MGLQKFYIRIAEIFRLNPDIKGIYSVGWLNDPHLADINPELRYIRNIPEQAGAKVFKIGTFPADISRSTTTSQIRKKLYKEGKYMPASYALIWLRADLIKWAESLGSLELNKLYRQ
jgi:hypothetical protein